jgi:nucleoside-diphosphate-sugar epimerase
MNVFFAGATGVIGRRLTPMLIAAGHQVTGMTRSDKKADLVRAAGAEPAVCDVYDVEGLGEAVAAAAPEVVIHQLTDLPPNVDPRKMEKQAEGNDRIRREGTRNLMQAALASGARRFIAQSIAFAYAPTGEGLKNEDDALFDNAPWPFKRSVQALHELEDITTGTDGIEGIALRYGFFYGPDTGYARDGYYASEAKRRRLPVVGNGGGVFSFIHVEDAARAAVAAIGNANPGIYNVVDDEPAPMREWVPRYAEALGAKKPFRIPKLIARLVAGRYTTMMATELRGATNERAKRELGWAPLHSSWRQGFRDALG